MLNFILVHTDFGVERGEFEKYTIWCIGKPDENGKSNYNGIVRMKARL